MLKMGIFEDKYDLGNSLISSIGGIFLIILFISLVDKGWGVTELIYVCSLFIIVEIMVFLLKIFGMLTNLSSDISNILFVKSWCLGMLGLIALLFIIVIQFWFIWLLGFLFLGVLYLLVLINRKLFFEG